MSALWDHSLKTENDINGKPMVGCQAFFYDANTTTPQTVYSDSDLATTLDQPVETNQFGRWPAVFMSANPGTYHSKVLDPTSALLWDVDGISVPQDADYVPPDAGSTDPTLLFTTGDYKAMHTTSPQTGWVRANGKTIGNAASGASERANADTSALFQFLYNADATLTVSGGRGANAAGDYAANKTIALPDLRSRALIGRGTMGNAAANLIADAQFDNSETADTLGATAGEGKHTLLTAEMASHTHTATTTLSTDPGHTHDTASRLSGAGGTDTIQSTGSTGTQTHVATQTVGAHTHTATTTNASIGSDTAHNNVQPSVAVTYFIKL